MTDTPNEPKKGIAASGDYDGATGIVTVNLALGPTSVVIASHLATLDDEEPNEHGLRSIDVLFGVLPQAFMQVIQAMQAEEEK